MPEFPRARLVNHLLIGGIIVSMALGGWTVYADYWPRHADVAEAVIANDYEDVARFLRSQPWLASENDGQQNPLLLALWSDNLNMTRFILDRGADVNVRGHFPTASAELIGFASEYQPIHAAVFMHDPDLVTLLVRYGADVNAADGNACTPLHHAAVHAASHVTRRLIEYGADPNRIGSTFDGEPDSLAHRMTPLALAILFGDNDTIDALLDGGANPDQSFFFEGESVTPLRLAVNRGEAECAERLLIGGADLAKLRSAHHSLICAALPSPATLGVLLRHGVSINTIDEHGETILHFAAVTADLEVIRWLVHHGVDVHRRNTDGLTALGKLIRTRDRVEAIFAKVDEGIAALAESDPDFGP